MSKTIPKGFTPDYLREQRKAKGLSVSQLSRLAGISVSSIRKYENGKNIPLLKNWDKLKRILSRESSDIHRDTWRTPPKEPRPQTKTYSFEEGHCYSIVDGYWKNKACDLISPISGWDCVFRYKGKEGIHHVFIEARGGWARTYTDAQLIGKQIKEVSYE